MDKLDESSTLLLEKTFETFGFNLTKEIINKFELYYDFLTEYNKKINLTSTTEKAEIFDKHFADSISCANLIVQNATVCDIGTGAGFPGVVLKIVRPDIKLTLVDSVFKKTIFLNELLHVLNLQAEVFHNRVEDIDFKNKFLNKFDFVVSRAVAEMCTLTEYCLPFVNLTGKFVAFKGPNITEELKKSEQAIYALGGKLQKVIKYKLPSGIEHSLVVISKTKKTDEKYPRGQNKPRLKPIVWFLSF